MDSIPHNRVRVLFHEVYHERFFGAARLLHNLVTGLDLSRYEPYLLVSGQGVVAERFAAAGIPVLVPPIHPLLTQYDGFAARTFRWQKARLLAALLAYQGQVVRLVRRLGIDIVHANTIRALLTSGPGARLGGAVTIFHLRGSMDARWRITRWGVRLAHRVIASDPALVDGLPLDHCKYTVIPDGVEPREVPAPSREPLWQQFRLPEGARVIGSLGYFAPVKGFQVLLQALPGVWEQFPETYCFIIGRAVDQAYWEHVEALRRSLPWPDKVICTGERDDRLALLGGFDVYVQPSFDEGFCLAVSEAMLAEKPVVGSAVPGIKQQVIPGETGFLVPSGDAKSLAAALVRLLAQPQVAQEMGARGRTRILEQFTIPQTVQQVQAVYDSLMAGKR